MGTENIPTASETASQGESIDSSRRNQKTAELINQALDIRQSAGRETAAAFLHAHGVQFSVIVRVLSEPQARRPNK